MDKNYEFSYKKKYLSTLILDGFISAMHSHKTLFKTLYTENSTHGMAIALAYLTEAHNYYVNAQTLLIDNVELLGERNEFDELFHRFSVYNKEFLTNARTDHSHQWSDIEFRDFVESFKPVAELLNIDEDSFWINKALSSDKE
ncbi:hypothetical protein RKS58_02445 [Lysinibacillus capsici]|uniref:hypothetical protein n=1 Tax=Lysinibacillus TaxID=400634 RepID=UPI001C8BA520|nr:MULTISPECIES: hypothetical protein [Lysinibacillus]MBX8942546.1 hypothetical protein [Lysinibacillus sp. K60]WNN76709.1 hypothetical protein RKS58_02445 [Lysinibacillus capsici]